MAEIFPTEMEKGEDAASIASIVKLHGGLRQALASGSLTIEQEVMIRSKIVTHFIQTFDQSGQYDYIPHAVQHLETILRRLPRDSPDRAKHLSSFSFIRVSEYISTHSPHALEEAVLNGRRAREISIKTDLLHHDPEVYFEVLANFGNALSQRYARFQKIKDLEDAITCAREVYDKAPKDSALYCVILNNLAARLRMRYLQSRNVDDINEALKLINELRSRKDPGTIELAMATFQLGSVASDKFEQTKKREDFEQALNYCKSALNSIPERHETRVTLLRRIVDLYSARHQQTSQDEDLRDLSIYSGMLFRHIPPDHATRGQFFLDYLRRLHKWLVTSRSVEHIHRAIQTIRATMNHMPPKYFEQYQCEGILADLCMEHYHLSHDLQDLVACLRSIQEMIWNYNDAVDQGATSERLLGTSWLWDLIECVQQLARVPPNNKMRTLAENGLPEMLRVCLQSQDSTASGLEQFHRQNGLRLEVLAEAAAAGRVLSDDEIAIETTKLKDTKAALTRERQGMRGIKSNDYKTELGVRSLAIDESKNMIADMGGLVGKILGYDGPNSYSLKEFTEMTIQAEQKATNEARLKGRHPNLRLCRMCRDLAKVLQPTAQGFELTAKNAWLPFGNIHQLRLRPDCSVCSLILSVITTRTGALHLRLAAIDREIQGVRLSTGTLSTNEKLMRFDYGMKHISQLRILTPQNYSQALRQAWEMDAQAVPWNLEQDNGPIHDQSQQQINPDLVKSWLNNCDHNHGFVCNHPRSRKRAENEIRLTLIDVKDECLVSASSEAKYFALSYVWGQVDMSKTLKSNYEERSQLGSFATIRFPKTIRDAMHFIRSLGERYLWVDAVCMVQDDEEQMARHIPTMEIVYGQAFATIIALEGTDADAGLPGVRAGTRQPQKITTLTISNNSPNLDDDPDSNNKQTIHLTATPLPLHLALELSQWNSRSWIVQEHLLSRRCLYFSPAAVYFQCGQETLSEGGANEEFQALMLDETALSDNFVLKNANRNNPISGLDVHDLAQRERLTKVFNAYTNLVATYSLRNLSFKSDILKAFAGMFAVLEEHFQSATFHGLPAAVISHALLWSPAARLPRRGSHLPSILDIPMSVPDPQFPSWSWVGWDGPVEYRIFERFKGDIVLPTSQVERYDTFNGPINDIAQERKESLEPTKRPPSDTGNEIPIGSRDGQSVKTGNKPDKEELQEERVLGKLIPDRVRGSTWVVEAPEEPQDRKDDSYITTKLLRFTARTVALPAFQVMPEKEYLSSRSQVHIRSSQAVRRIKDRDGKHCGLWWEQAGYSYVGLHMSSEAESKINMLEISRYGDAYRRRDGPYLVEGPMSIFDEEAFPAVGPGSGLVNILVVDLDMGLPDGIAERCTVAVIHSAAWEAAHPREKEVQLV